MGGSETVVHRVDCIVALAFGSAETNALDLGRNHALNDPLSKEPWTNLLVLISYDDDDVYYISYASRPQPVLDATPQRASSRMGLQGLRPRQVISKVVPPHHNLLAVARHGVRSM